MKRNIIVVIGDSNGRLIIYNSSYASLSLVNSFQGHTKWISQIKQSPFTNDYVATCSGDKTVKIWNVSFIQFNWTLIQTYSQHLSEVSALDWLGKDTLASSGWLDKTIKKWALKTGQTKQIINTPDFVQSLKFLSDQTHLVAGLYSGDINIYDIDNNGGLSSSLQGHTSSVYDFAQLSDDLMASSSNDTTVKIWDLTTSTCMFTLTGHSNAVYRLKQISLDILASGSEDMTIKLWNITSGEEIRTLTGHTSYVFLSIDLIDSQTLVSGSQDQTIKLWNWATGECLSTIKANTKIETLAVTATNLNL
jgi:WD40 repeat protein